MGATELELMHRARADRYAELEARAAAVDERVSELTEKLSEAEWAARIAQDQVAAVEYDSTFGKVWTAGMDAPAVDEAKALLDLTTGEVFLRELWANGQYGELWIKAGRSPRGQSRCDWPMEGGPFIAFREDWGFERVLKSAAEQDQREDKLRQFIYGKDGYQSEDATAWTRPDLAAAYARVVTELERKHAQRLGEFRELEHRLARMRYVCLTCSEKYHDADMDHAKGCAYPQVARYELIPE